MEIPAGFNMRRVFVLSKAEFDSRPKYLNFEKCREIDSAYAIDIAKSTRSFIAPIFTDGVELSKPVRLDVLPKRGSETTHTRSVKEPISLGRNRYCSKEAPLT